MSGQTSTDDDESVTHARQEMTSAQLMTNSPVVLSAQVSSLMSPISSQGSSGGVNNSIIRNSYSFMSNYQGTANLGKNNSKILSFT